MENYDANKKYVVLEHLMGIDKGYRFWSTNSGAEKELGWSHDEHGKKVQAYKPVWFTDSENEAIAKCSETKTEARIDGLQHHMLKMQKSILVSQLYEINEQLGLPLDDTKQCG